MHKINVYLSVWVLMLYFILSGGRKEINLPVVPKRRFTLYSPKVTKCVLNTAFDI